MCNCWFINKIWWWWGGGGRVHEGTWEKIKITRGNDLLCCISLPRHSYDFQGFRTLCLRNLRKSLVGCRLSTDPKIHDLEWRYVEWLYFTLIFHYYDLRTAHWEIIHILTVESVYTRDQRRCAEADRDPQNRVFWDPWKNCGSFVDATSSEQSINQSINLYCKNRADRTQQSNNKTRKRQVMKNGR